MPIDFLDLLADDGWEPAGLVPAGSGVAWSEGSSLSDAPVDVQATFDGVRRSSGIDEIFGLQGVRLPPGFTGPQRRHDQALLIIVFEGTLVVRSVTDDGEAEDQLGPGRFAVIDKGTVHSVGAGPDGATYTECWPQDAAEVDTVWFPGPEWAT